MIASVPLFNHEPSVQGVAAGGQPVIEHPILCLSPPPVGKQILSIRVQDAEDVQLCVRSRTPSFNRKSKVKVKIYVTKPQ